MQVLITGHTRGIGAALATLFLERGDQVYGLARGTLAGSSERLRQCTVDFAAPATLGAALERLFEGSAGPALVFLNAGVLGPIAAMTTVDLAQLRAVMDVNVWANKVILDWLSARSPPPQQLLTLSSGAALRGNYGWGAYAMSKAALNMLTQLYAHELPQTHLTALAPGLVDTAMQATLREKSAAEFPSLKRLHAAAGSPDMPTPARAAARIVAALERLREQPSGQFFDLRTLEAGAP